MHLQDDAFNTFFSETGAGKHVPRSIFLDLEVCHSQSELVGSTFLVHLKWAIRSVVKMAGKQVHSAQPWDSRLLYWTIGYSGGEGGSTATQGNYFHSMWSTL